MEPCNFKNWFTSVGEGRIIEVKELVGKYQDYVRDQRRFFHQYPELSYQEVETTRRIAVELDKMGIPYEINNEKNTGLVGIIHGKHPGKAVALRADIDGLNVTETNTFSFKSQNAGAMHACGHDAHIAMLLGAARMLMEMRDQIHGVVYLVFQPAEELGNGAPYMLRFGNWYQEVGALFGAHVWIDLPAGQISVEGGERMAAGARFSIKVRGRSGHASQPQQTIDATVVSAAILMNLQSIVARHVHPLDAVVLTVGSMHSGTRFNIISGEAEMEGTTRYFRREIGEDIQKQMEKIIMNTAQAYGAEAEFRYDLMIPATINDAAISQIAEQAVVKVLGKASLAKMRKVMGGEDFAYYLEHKPGCYGFVGIYNPEVGATHSHHSNNFNMDDSILSGGSGVYAQFALDWLKENQ